MTVVEPLMILLVEDKKALARSIKIGLEKKLNDKGVSSQVFIKNTVKEGIDALNEKDYDLAVVDLRFKQTAGGGQLTGNGNDLVEEITNNFSLPIIIYTIYEKDLHKPYKVHENGFIYVTPEKKVPFIVDKVVEWKNDGVIDVFSMRGRLPDKLKNTMRDTVWSAISPNWTFLKQTDANKIAEMAGRITASVIQEELTTDCVGMGEAPIHHGEIYLKKIKRPYLAVGDLVLREGEYYVVMTPSCDLIPRKADEGEGCTTNFNANKILIATGKSLKVYASDNDYLRGLLNNYQSTNEGKKKKALNDINRVFHHAVQNASGRYFFLPPFADFEGLVVDFNDYITMPCNEGTVGRLVAERQATLTREMAAELATHFSRYLSRLGQSEYQPVPLAEALRSVLGGQ